MCVRVTQRENQQETVYVVGNIVLASYLYWVFCFYIPVCGHGTYRCKCLYDNMSYTSLFTLLHFCGHGFMRICVLNFGGRI